MKAAFVIDGDHVARRFLRHASMHGVIVPLDAKLALQRLIGETITLSQDLGARVALARQGENPHNFSPKPPFIYEFMDSSGEECCISYELGGAIHIRTLNRDGYTSLDSVGADVLAYALLHASAMYRKGAS